MVTVTGVVSESHGTAITSLARDPPDHGEWHTHDVVVLVSEIKTTLSDTILL